jgi:hypothetical protein
MRRVSSPTVIVGEDDSVVIIHRLAGSGDAEKQTETGTMGVDTSAAN